VVVAFQGDPWLPSCVAFIKENREQAVRVVIGDNYGNTIVPSLADGRDVVSVALPGPLGFAEANNRTLVQIGFDARYICFLNQDTRSPPGWLTKAARFLDEHPDIGAITPLISTYDGDGWDPNFVACTKPLPEFFEELERVGGPGEFYGVPVIPAPAMLVRTAVLKKVGGFDPIYGSYYEDFDLCHRIREAGYRLGIWTGATVAHYSGSAATTPDAERRRQRQIVRNRIIFRVRNAGKRRVRQLGREWLWELPRQLGRRLLDRPASKSIGVLLGGYWDAAHLSRRLVSAKHDSHVWCAYLAAIGWPIRDCVLAAPPPPGAGRRGIG
jgi:GT2 family glycosyltransferase